jgi:hypothetical protein
VTFDRNASWTVDASSKGHRRAAVGTRIAHSVLPEGAVSRKLPLKPTTEDLPERRRNPRFQSPNPVTTNRDDKSRSQTIDSKLIDRIHAGDPDAFSDVYETYRPSVYRFILMRIKDASEAEDLTQETSVQAYRSLRIALLVDEGNQRDGEPVADVAVVLARILEHLKFLIGVLMPDGNDEVSADDELLDQRRRNLAAAGRYEGRQASRRSKATLISASSTQ